MADDQHRALKDQTTSDVWAFSYPRSGVRPGAQMRTASASVTSISDQGITLHVEDYADESKRGTTFQIDIPQHVMIALTRAIIDEALKARKPKPIIEP